jgi:hypothetical protein
MAAERVALPEALRQGQEPAADPLRQIVGGPSRIGLLILRSVVGGLLVGHGAQKPFGWFGGYGLDGPADGSNR